MTDKKFTDDEIILGLKCLAGEDEIFCKDCAFRDMDRGFACKKNVSKASLDLIARQKAEIERLTDLINEIAEANEDLVRDNHDLYVSLKKRDAEIERLKEFEHMYNDLCK